MKTLRKQWAQTNFWRQLKRQRLSAPSNSKIYVPDLHQLLLVMFMTISIVKVQFEVHWLRRLIMKVLNTCNIYPACIRIITLNATNMFLLNNTSIYEQHILFDDSASWNCWAIITDALKFVELRMHFINKNLDFDLKGWINNKIIQRQKMQVVYFV